MKSLIIANWKMNPTSFREAKKLFDAVKKAKSKNTEVVICPPFVYISNLKFHPPAGRHGISNLFLGAQDVFWEEKGAFTGEISGPQLKDLKVEYVIVGHSERRKYFGETNETINKKLKKVLETGLKPIFCVGENEGEDKAMVLEKQITEGLQNISRSDAKSLSIAYEPVWAIGTGKNCSTDETMKSVLLIRKVASQLYNREIADSVRILYGGSVNGKNAANYLKDAGVQGLLVGGASLNPEEVLLIIKSAAS